LVLISEPNNKNWNVSLANVSDNIYNTLNADKKLVLLCGIIVITPIRPREMIEIDSIIYEPMNKALSSEGTGRRQHAHLSLKAACLADSDYRTDKKMYCRCPN
jgi:hypothetical protein